MNRILCSTGALIGKPNGYDYTLLPGAAEKLECDGFELMFDDWDDLADAERVLRGIEARTGKPFPVLHIEKKVGDLISRNAPGDTEEAAAAFEKNCSFAKRIGAEKLVLHLWSGMDSDKYLPHNMLLYRRLRETAESMGLLLTVENVVCSFFDPMTHMRTLLEFFPDMSFTFDTKMADFHGQLDGIYLPANRNIWEHTVHLHVNDRAGEAGDWKALRTLHIGEGHIDIARFMRFVRETGYGGDITLEATSFREDGSIDIESMNRSISRVRRESDIVT